MTLIIDFFRTRWLWLLAVVAIITILCVGGLIFSLLGAGRGQRDFALAPQSVVGGSADAEFAYEEAAPEQKLNLSDAVTGSAAGLPASEPVSIEAFLASAVSQAQANRVIIYTGDISLVVKDTQAAIETITGVAEGQGGFVSGSNVFRSGEVLRGNITIRVPADRYQDTLTQLREFAIRVERESSSTQDVTEEFTDLQARKTNLEFTEAALQKLLDERQRVGSTADILEVHRELTTIRGQIEQIEGRLRYLVNQAALSTITIELIPDVLYQPVSVAGWEPQGVAKEALQSLVIALQGVANAAIWLVIFLIPLLIVLLIPLVIIVWLIRWWWRRYQARRKRSQPAVAMEA